MVTAALVTASPAITTRVLHGMPAERRNHPRGAVWLFPAGEVVFYAVRIRRIRGFVFRTLRQDEPFSSELPGVSPRTRLLLQTATVGRLRRLEELLVYLNQSGRSPTALSDGFYLRLHAILSGRLPRAKVLRSLLEQETHAQASA